MVGDGDGEGKGRESGVCLFVCLFVGWMVVVVDR